MFSTEIFNNILNEYEFSNLLELKQLSLTNKTFYSIIKKLIINLTLKKRDKNYIITINDKIIIGKEESKEKKIYEKILILFQNWIINEITYKNKNNYYKEYVYKCKKLIVPNKLFYSSLEKFYYYYFDPSDFIENLNNDISYLIEDNMMFNSNLNDSQEGFDFKYGIVEGKKLYLLSERFIENQIQEENLIEVL
jgi:predicted DNA-binding ArsR family transcriptional regulator